MAAVRVHEGLRLRSLFVLVDIWAAVLCSYQRVVLVRAAVHIEAPCGLVTGHGIAGDER